MRADLVAMGIMEEIRDPLWGELFLKVITDKLTVEDLYFAENRMIKSRPTWVGIVAGGNPDLLKDVAEVSLAGFMASLMMEIEESDLVEQLDDSLVLNLPRNWETSHLNVTVVQSDAI